MIRIHESSLYRSLMVLEKKDRVRIRIVVLIQFFLSLLDLVGVAVIGILGALAVSGVQSGNPGGRVAKALKLFSLDDLVFQTQIAILGIGASVILIIRTLLSIYFSRKILFFLSRRAAMISSTLVSKLLSQPILVIQRLSTQQSLYSLTDGVSAITVGVIGNFVAIISDGLLLAILTGALVVVDPTMAFLTISFFASIALLLYKLMHIRAQVLGAENSRLSIESNEKIVEVISSYREAVVRNRRGYYSREIGSLRLQLSNSLAELSFMPNISKYVIETAIVLGALGISAVQFLQKDASHAVATLAVFMAAGSRIAPALLRIQQGAVNLKGATGTSLPTLNLIENLADENAHEESILGNNNFSHENFHPNIELTDISVKYPNASEFAISGITLNIPAGSVIAIVGPSGAGKSTLTDLILGILEPDTGRIEISGLSPNAAVKEWSGAISYVPQEIYISNGTIRENVALGYPDEVATDNLVWDALRLSELDEVVRNLPHQLEEWVGDRGSKLSGGQRQRLGIARALFTKPKLLLLDEATSALDGSTEAKLSKSIQRLKGDTTVIMVAHRLSTVRSADRVIYLENGKILADGKFENVRKEVPDFDYQAKLMGL